MTYDVIWVKGNKPFASAALKPGNDYFGLL
jgi:hypothetical protein